jgi:hypothetical protein
MSNCSPEGARFEVGMEVVGRTVRGSSQTEVFGNLYNNRLTLHDQNPIDLDARCDCHPPTVDIDDLAAHLEFGAEGRGTSIVNGERARDATVGGASVVETSTLGAVESGCSSGRGMAIDDAGEEASVDEAGNGRVVRGGSESGHRLVAIPVGLQLVSVLV